MTESFHFHGNETWQRLFSLTIDIYKISLKAKHVYQIVTLKTGLNFDQEKVALLHRLIKLRLEKYEMFNFLF